MFWKLVPLVLIFGFTALAVGCGESVTTTTTTTASTTTTTIAASYVNTAKASSIMGSGGVTMGSAAGGIGQSASASVSSVSSIRAFDSSESGPPASFFSENIRTGSAASDGYVLVSTEAAGGNIVPYIRMYTQNGDLIAGTTFLNGKKIATLEGITLQEIMSGGGGGAAMQTAITNFAASFAAASDPYNELYGQIDTYADYMAWAFIYTDMGGEGINFEFATPEASLTDKIGSMECKMVFQDSATGTLTFFIPVSSEGSPLDGNTSGNCTLTTTSSPAVTIEATITMTFASGNPSTMRLSGTTTPEGNIINLTMDPNTGTGTGTISDESGTAIGTFETGASGGTIYIGGTAEDFTF